MFPPSDTVCDVLSHAPTVLLFLPWGAPPPARCFVSVRRTCSARLRGTNSRGFPLAVSVCSSFLPRGSPAASRSVSNSFGDRATSRPRRLRHGFRRGTLCHPDAGPSTGDVFLLLADFKMFLFSISSQNLGHQAREHGFPSV